MKPAALLNSPLLHATAKNINLFFLLVFLSGLISPLGFAPFHLPGMTILSLVFFYLIINNHSKKHSFIFGFLFGLGYFGFGVSWVIISVHDYGNLNYFLSGLTTLFFIFYLSLYPALVSYCFKRWSLPQNKLFNGLFFSCLWSFSEYLRANLLTGFPWLLIGTTQIDTPLKYLIPILGVYGVSFVCVFASSLFALALREQSIKRYYYSIFFVLLLVTPSLLKNTQWTKINSQPITIGVIQANLAMRDKWDDSLFWSLLKHYETNINALLGKQLIILPESAIPLPASYLEEYLLNIKQKTLKAHSALVFGILQPTDDSETSFYNSIKTLGHAQGEHVKKQLVPFGEYIPKPFSALNRWLDLPEPNIVPNKIKENLIKIHQHPVASLICYEIAYPYLLRQQMPLAEWIISISDNGWFGHSLASYQQLQMAQVLSLLTGRFQVVANNDGLSSVINNQGDLVDSLPAFSAGILQSEIFSAFGATPWIMWGNYPFLFFCVILFFLQFFLRHKTIPQQ
jgi:apolipoprotein N-acyltransferase